MFAKWERSWRWLSLIGSKWDAGAGFLRAVTTSCAAAIAALVVEAWGILTLDRNKEIVYAYFQRNFW